MNTLNLDVTATKLFGKFFRPVIDTLFFFEPNHCMHAYLAELERAQLPKNFN